MKKIIKSLLPMYYLEEPGRIYGFDKKELLKLKDRWEGKRCFIIGNGPSLNKCDLTNLKDEYSFGVNGIFYKSDEMGFKPTFYVVEDSAVMADNTERINQYDCEFKFFPSIYKRKIKNRKNTLFLNMNRGFYEPKSDFYEFPRFSPNIANRVYVGQSVTIMNLQLAYHFGFSQVYLIGMDFNYDLPERDIVDGARILSQGDDINHFNPNYFGKGKVWHDPKLHNVLKSYQLCKLVYEMDGRKIFNATVGGKLELFERIDYNSLFV